MSDTIGMGQNGFGDIIFTISVNFRDTRVNAWAGQGSIWNSTLRFGGIDSMIDLIFHLRLTYHLVIGRATAEALVLHNVEHIQGRNFNDGLPRELKVTRIEIQEVLSAGISDLTEDIRFILREPETRETVIPSYPARIPMTLKPALTIHPIVLTGEFGRLPGLDRRLQDALALLVVFSESMS